MNAQNIGRALESAEHNHQTSVFFDVRDSLNAAAGEVEIGDGVGRQDADRIESLWRKIDEAIRVERRGGDEKHALFFDELLYGFVYQSLSFAHLRHSFFVRTGWS